MFSKVQGHLLSMRGKTIFKFLSLQRSRNKNVFLLKQKNLDRIVMISKYYMQLNILSDSREKYILHTQNAEGYASSTPRLQQISAELPRMLFATL